MTITTQLLKVLQQKYGPAISVTEGAEIIGSEQKALIVANGAVMKVLLIVTNEISRGTQYQIYEMTHSVFDPK